MRKIFCVFVIIISTQIVYAQNSAVGISYDHIFGGGATRLAQYDGFGSYHFQKGYKIALHYSYQLKDNFRITSGLQHQEQWMQSRNLSTTGELRTRDIKVETINIPFYANLTFLKYFFIEGGPLLNIQTNKPYGVDQQTGIGFSGSLGAQYSIKKISFFVKSQGQIQTLIIFNGNSSRLRNTSNSLSIGIFYQL